MLSVGVTGWYFANTAASTQGWSVHAFTDHFPCACMPFFGFANKRIVHEQELFSGMDQIRAIIACGVSHARKWKSSCAKRKKSTLFFRIKLIYLLVYYFLSTLSSMVLLGLVFAFSILVYRASEHLTSLCTGVHYKTIRYFWVFKTGRVINTTVPVGILSLS